MAEKKKAKTKEEKEAKTEEAKEAVKQFLETPFSDSPRHARRLAKF